MLVGVGSAKLSSTFFPVRAEAPGMQERSAMTHLRAQSIQLSFLEIGPNPSLFPQAHPSPKGKIPQAVTSHERGGSLPAYTPTSEGQRWAKFPAPCSLPSRPGQGFPSMKLPGLFGLALVLRACVLLCVGMGRGHGPPPLRSSVVTAVTLPIFWEC